MNTIKVRLILLVIIFFVSAAIMLAFARGMFKPIEKHVVNAVFIGPEKYKSSFEQSMTIGRQFYDLYGKARESIKINDYDSAIAYLNESLQYVGIGLEKGMVYSKLAEIYRVQGNLERELFYIDQVPKYTLNEQINEEAKRRAAEIRTQLVAESKKQK